MELNNVKRQIDQTVEDSSRVREKLNELRKKMMRALHRFSQTADASEQEQLSADLRQLQQDEAVLGEGLRELEKALSELWAVRRRMEGTALPATEPTDVEAEEQRLRWSLLELKSKQLEAAEQWRATEDPAERSLHEGRFNELREQYNSAYDRLTEIRESRHKEQ